MNRVLEDTCWPSCGDGPRRIGPACDGTGVAQAKPCAKIGPRSNCLAGTNGSDHGGSTISGPMTGTLIEAPAPTKVFCDDDKRGGELLQTVSVFETCHFLEVLSQAGITQHKGILGEYCFAGACG